MLRSIGMDGGTECTYLSFPSSPTIRYTGSVMQPTYTAIVQQSGEWWIGWIEEVPGVNSQGATRDELLDNLSSALREALEMNREDALSATQGPYEEVSIAA
jgi:predicted RNase H-like HicB family nuclease